MSYHHSQRVIAHLNPIRQSANDKSMSGNRHDKLSASAQLVLQHIASALNMKTGSFPMSIQNLYKRTRLSKQTIQKSLDRLVEFGVLERERRKHRQANTYYLKLQCPDDCNNLKEHNTPRELSERPNSQDTTAPESSESISASPSHRVAISPNYQVASVLDNSSLIKIDKDKDKEYVRQHCSSCKASIETIAGTTQAIHLDGCKQLSRLMSSQGWLIAAKKLGGDWQALSARQKQVHYHIDIAGYKERTSEKDKQSLRAEEHANEKASRHIPEGTLRNWAAWLRSNYKRYGDIPMQHLNLAAKNSRAGVDLLSDKPWEKGSYPLEGIDYHAYVGSELTEELENV